MRLLGLPLLLVGVSLPTGCFEEPDPGTSGSATAGDSSGTGGDPGTTTGDSRATTTGTQTSADETTSSTSAGTSPPETTSGPPDDALLLYPLTCTEAEWTVGPGGLECGAMEVGPFLDTHDTFTLGGRSFDRVIEVRPPNAGAVPVDGFFEIDTTGFLSPQFRSQVACGDTAACQIDFIITSELGDKVLSDWGGGVADGDAITEVTLNLPLEPSVLIHLNLNAPNAAGESRFLWIDPRVVEAP